MRSLTKADKLNSIIYQKEDDKMSRTPNIHGGGAQTNKNGLSFEQATSLNDALEQAGYTIFGPHIFMDGEEIGMSVSKHQFYNDFLEPQGIDYTNYNSKKWLPDEAFVNYHMRTVYIIEKKFQNTGGSVDEKLTNCDFKRWEYQKLCKPIGYDVEYIYVLSDWFRNPKYKDYLDYVEYQHCPYYFNKLPLRVLGL